MSFVFLFSSLTDSSFWTFVLNVKPVFLHGLSGFLHLLLLVALLVSFVWNKVIVGSRDSSKEKIKNTLFTRTLICSLGVTAFNLLLFLFDYFCWYRNGWSEEKLVTLLDSALKTVAWGVVCVCLQRELFSSSERRLPFFFRAWCAFYLFVSSYCFIVNIVIYEKHAALPIQCLVSDAFSACVGLFICYLGFFVKNEGGVGDRSLQEPLFNGDPIDHNVLGTKETKENDTVTPYSNAGIFSILTFSWVSPLIAVGKKKTLDLEDVPQLDKRDSLVGAFPTFRDKLEAYCGDIC